MTGPFLEQRLDEAQATCHRARGPAELARALSQFECRLLVLEDHPWLRAAAGYLQDGDAPEIHFFSGSPQPLPEDLDTVVTIGLGAVPETGSVLVGGDRPQALRLSLRPRRHLVVIPEDRAALTLAAALALTAAEPSGLVSWLTGPSRTADIEKVLVLGAQGASEVAVIIYQDT